MQPTESSLVGLVRDIVDIKGRVERHPYGMMAGAMGAGFVLGGGLFTRLTERLAGVVVRTGVMAALPRLEEELKRYLRRDAEATTPPTGKGE